MKNQISPLLHSNVRFLPTQWDKGKEAAGKSSGPPAAAGPARRTTDPGALPNSKAASYPFFTLDCFVACQQLLFFLLS